MQFMMNTGGSIGGAGHGTLAGEVYSPDDARAVTGNWLEVYNEKRIHSAIGHLPPKAFKQRSPQLQKSLHSAGTA